MNNASPTEPSREPLLGLATTEQLLNELRARIEVDYFNGGGGLQYTTSDGRPKSVTASIHISTEGDES